MRCWALAEEFSARGASISFTGRFEVPWVVDLIQASSWTLYRPLQTLEHLRRGPGPHLVVVDSYEDTGALRSTLLDNGVPVLAIVDDFHTELGPASLWLNPGAPSHHGFSQPSKLLEGPEYVLIRREIRHLRKVRKQRESRRDQFSGLTFLLGGTDFAGIGTTLCELKSSSKLPGPIWAGPGQGSGEGLVQWLSAGPEIMRRMATSEFVVSPAGVSSWELAHIGVPFALIMATDNQAGNYNFMTKAGWAQGLGKAEDLVREGVDSLVHTLSRAIHRFGTENQGGISRIDGLGAKRVVDACFTLL